MALTPLLIAKTFTQLAHLEGPAEAVVGVASLHVALGLQVSSNRRTVVRWSPVSSPSLVELAPPSSELSKA
ncbi:hypothetical protein [Pseudomonas vancouverensis]|uniref:hypothetical protein n=1 Tax=Pseudomonas vancouverensis TaxID=95300 RepID=UPI0012FDDAC3|nr:hypothetical protein [Pseudomonas vancouverensis]